MRFGIIAVIATVLFVGGAANAQKVVAGTAVRTDLRQYSDLSVRINDHLGGSSHFFTRAEEGAGLRDQNVIKVFLLDAGIWAFLPRDAKTKARLAKLHRGDPIVVEGVIESQRIPGWRSMVGTAAFPERTYFFLRASKVANAKPAGRSTGKVRGKKVTLRRAVNTAQNVSFTVPDFADNDIVFTRQVPTARLLRDTFTPWEQSQGLSGATALKLDLGLGFPTFVERSDENVKALKGWAPGTLVRLYGRLRIPETGSGQPPLLIVQQFEVIPQPSAFDAKPVR